MAEQPPPNRPYTPLPDELKPHYRSRSDFRLMSRAYRLGWARDVPAERQPEWCEDLVRALTAEEATPAQHAAIRVVLAAQGYELKLYREWIKKLILCYKRPRGRPRKHPRAAPQGTIMPPS